MSEKKMTRDELRSALADKGMMFPHEVYDGLVAVGAIAPNLPVDTFKDIAVRLEQRIKYLREMYEPDYYSGNKALVTLDIISELSKVLVALEACVKRQKQ